jgi:hypothetical protein
MWTKKKNEAAGGESFESVAATLTEKPEEVSQQARESVAEIPSGEERFEIRLEWADATTRACFLPLARFDHPAWALDDNDAAAVAPKMQAFLQAVADKYAPQVLGKFATKHAELFDLTMAVGVLLWSKFRYVTAIKRQEALEAFERAKLAEEARRKEAESRDALPKAA